MRIRKNSKISPLVAPNSSENTHLCQLNQSPWDVPIVDSSTPSPYPQVDGGDMFTGNGSLGDSIGALRSVASLKISVDDEDYSNIYGEEEEEEEKNETAYCCKTDGEGNFVCGREAKDGHSLCDFHLAHFRSSNNSVHRVSKKSAKNRAVHRAKKSKSESNPYHIYYYSGFGPRWGKKRGADKLAEPAKEVVEPEETEAAVPMPSASTPLRVGGENFKYFEDDYEEEDDEDEHINVGNGKKRGRKPIKARSLKSLM